MNSSISPQPVLISTLSANIYRLEAGGRKAMIESPVLQRLLQETKQETRQETKQQDILRLLVLRFRIAAADLEAELSSIDDEERLDLLFDLAATCSDLDSFRKHLSP